MLAAVSIYNSPIITFKTEICISLICNAWTYLLQAYCLSNKIEIRIPDSTSKRRRYMRSDDGDYLTIRLIDLATKSVGFLDEPTIKNIELIAKIRNKVQHSADSVIDEAVAPLLQANVIDFREALLSYSDGLLDISERANLALQFEELSVTQIQNLFTTSRKSKWLKTFIADFESNLSPEVLSSSSYTAKISFRLENKGSGLSVLISHIGDDVSSEEPEIVLKETEKKKYRPGEIVQKMKDEGFSRFTMHVHTTLWRELHKSAKKEGAGFGTTVSGTWYWYDKWVDEVVRPYCQKYLNSD